MTLKSAYKSKREAARQTQHLAKQAQALETQRALAEAQLRSHLDKIEAICVKLRTKYIQTHFKKQSKLANRRKILMTQALHLQKSLGLGATA